MINYTFFSFSDVASIVVRQGVILYNNKNAIAGKPSFDIKKIYHSLDCMLSTEDINNLISSGLLIQKTQEEFNKQAFKKTDDVSNNTTNKL